MKHRLLLAVGFAAFLAHAVPVRAGEKERTEQTMAMIEERKMKPLLAMLAKFLIEAGHGRMDKAKEVIDFSDNLGQMMEGDPGLRLLKANPDSFKGVELVGFNVISASMLEFFLLVPTAKGHVGFIIGTSSYNGKARLGVLVGATEWSEIVKMKDRVELFPATVTMEPNGQ